MRLEIFQIHCYEDYFYPKTTLYSRFQIFLFYFKLQIAHFASQRDQIRNSGVIVERGTPFQLPASNRRKTMKLTTTVTVRFGYAFAATTQNVLQFAWIICILLSIVRKRKMNHVWYRIAREISRYFKRRGVENTVDLKVE